jgi:NAD(P)-dependent dehydrogenase (short-subunit alcohol dehydrogenase family)
VIFFVTGGSRGIGAAIVLQAESEGHDVAFTYHSDEASARAVAEKAASSGRRVRAYQLDVRDPEAVERVAEQVTSDLGDVQVVVNNAGVVRSNLVAMMTDDEWREVLDTNLSGAFYVCRAFLPAMLVGGFGRIINISSVVSGGMAGMANYAASKAGLYGLTKTLAKEYGRKNITANCIIAGAVETDMARDELSDKVMRFGRENAPVPDGRLGTPEEIARIVMFLASANYMNGAEVRVTGGLDWLP